LIERIGTRAFIPTASYSLATSLPLVSRRRQERQGKEVAATTSCMALIALILIEIPSKILLAQHSTGGLRQDALRLSAGRRYELRRSKPFNCVGSCDTPERERTKNRGRRWVFVIKESRDFSSRIKIGDWQATWRHHAGVQVRADAPIGKADGGG
jgi:hypothetical protein